MHGPAVGGAIMRWIDVYGGIQGDVDTFSPRASWPMILHGHGRPPALPSLRRSAGRPGLRLYSHRDDCLALLDSRLDDPSSPSPQPLPDPIDRARRRRNDLRSRHDSLRIAMRGLLALIAVGVARLAAARARGTTEAFALQPTGATVTALRKLVEGHFHKDRQLAFSADKPAMTVDPPNEHARRATGVTAGH